MKSGWFGGDVLGHLDSCLVNSLRHSLATAEEYRANQKIACEQKVSGPLHSLDRHLLSRLYVVRKPSAPLAA
ncbi:MAG: hypothetical protein DMF09_04735 [Verrucomicrobia bacterium]|nr:MAG: hypothetical protein DMF09_04735 [Verrucomicrobiota bacterium]